MKKLIAVMMIISLLLGLMGCDLTLNPATKGENIEPFERLFDDTKVKTLRVIITDEKWQELDTAMIDYFVRWGHYRTDYMVEADLEFEDDLGKVLIERIGFRTRGNTSRDRIQNDQGEPQLQHFKLSFHEDYTEKIAKRTAFELEEIDLKFNHNYDETYLTEKFSLDLMNSFGIHAAHTTLVKLFITIGDETFDYGIYTAFEPIDDNFIKRRFSKAESDGNLYKSLWQNFDPANLGPITSQRAIGIKNESTNYRPSYDLKTNKVEEDHRNLEMLIENLNSLSGEALTNYMKENFEIDLFLRYLAVSALLGNPDDYRAMANNYFLYQNSESQKWMVIPYDYDHGMGQGWNGDDLFSNWSIGFDIYDWANVNAKLTGNPNYPHILVDHLLSVPEFQVTYEAYLAELIDPANAYFTVDAFMAIYNAQKNLYDGTQLESLLTLPFGLREVVKYIQDKTSDINSQLLYYQSNPTERG